VLNQYRKRLPAARVKLRMKENGIKMYDKHGSVMRIETVINHPYELKVRPRGRRKGQQVLSWFPMANGVTNLYPYAEVRHAADSCHLDALSTVGNPAQANQHLEKSANAISHNQRFYRGFNPAAKRDIDLFAAVLRGEHAIIGFRNRDIFHRLFSRIKDLSALRRPGAPVCRLPKLLHIHQIISKIPRPRRWRVTPPKGDPSWLWSQEMHAP
jgi:hypothetical protein